MNTRHVMRWLLAGLMGFAAGAWGRGIPVYREYTRPIVFYDETGQQAEWEQIAPDRAARQSLRETQAQEALMGKETLLEMRLGQGATLFGQEEPPPAMVVPAPLSPMNRSRRRQEASSRNWLAESMEMPALGQSASNAAQAAMAEAGAESGWEWLDNDLTGGAASGSRSVEFQIEQDRTVLKFPGWSDRDGADSMVAGRWGTMAGGGALESAAMVPESLDMGESLNESQTQSAYTRSLLRGEESGSRAASWNKTGSGLGAGLSQTRQMIADLSPRELIPSANRKTLFGGMATAESLRPQDAGAGLARESFPSAPAGLSTSDGFTAGWGKGEEHARDDFGRVQALGATRQNTWKGGWNVKPVEGMAWGGVQGADESSVPGSVDRSTSPDSRELLRPDTSSGGYKPAWY